MLVIQHYPPSPTHQGLRGYTPVSPKACLHRIIFNPNDWYNWTSVQTLHSDFSNNLVEKNIRPQESYTQKRYSRASIWGSMSEGITRPQRARPSPRGRWSASHTSLYHRQVNINTTDAHGWKIRNRQDLDRVIYQLYQGAGRPAQKATDFLPRGLHRMG